MNVNYISSLEKELETALRDKDILLTKYRERASEQMSSLEMTKTRLSERDTEVQECMFVDVNVIIHSNHENRGGQ